MRGDHDGSDVGTRTILPSTWEYVLLYYFHLQRELARDQGVHGIISNDRSDITDRVFERKVQDYVKFVRNQRLFGDVTTVLYTIEFQKGGLPHCHSMIWNSEATKVQRDEDVYRYISVELLDEIEQSRI
ncbi:DNA helicase [Tanacetum coccineum]